MPWNDAVWRMLLPSSGATGDDLSPIHLRINDHDR